MFEKFETIHQNKRYAFADGLLCGIVATVVVGNVIREFRNPKRRERLYEVDTVDNVVDIRTPENE